MVIVDRWTMSAAVYSILRFEALGIQVTDEYIASIIQGELVPDHTLVIEADSHVIVERMKKRICDMNGEYRD